VAGGAGSGEAGEDGGFRDRGEADGVDAQVDGPVVRAGGLDDVADGDGTNVAGPRLAVVVGALPVADGEDGMGGGLVTVNAVAGVEDQAQRTAVGRCWLADGPDSAAAAG
jgi:hypothetical protein